MPVRYQAAPRPVATKGAPTPRRLRELNPAATERRRLCLDHSPRAATEALTRRTLGAPSMCHPRFSSSITLRWSCYTTTPEGAAEVTNSSNLRPKRAACF